MTEKLKPCPCGETPEGLEIIDNNSKWYHAYGFCCGEWIIEFRSFYHPVESKEAYDLAVEAWNRMPRKETQ